MPSNQCFSDMLSLLRWNSFMRGCILLAGDLLRAHKWTRLIISHRHYLASDMIAKCHHQWCPVGYDTKPRNHFSDDLHQTKSILGLLWMATVAQGFDPQPHLTSQWLGSGGMMVGWIMLGQMTVAGWSWQSKWSSLLGGWRRNIGEAIVPWFEPTSV